MNSYRIKEIVGHSAPLQWCWAGGMTAYALTLLWRGRQFDAARLLLKLDKHLNGGAFASVRRPLVNRITAESCRQRNRLGTLGENELLRVFSQSTEARAIRRRFASYGPAHQVRLRLPRDDGDRERQGDLIILKRHDTATGERGVVLVKYHESILACAAVFDLAALVQQFIIVLEPSNWGYQDARFLLYIGRDAPVVIECARAPDFEYIQCLESNLTPVRLGDGEWVDPARFTPRQTPEARFDVVMVGAWDPLKRHEVLFRAIARLKDQGCRLRVALVGYPLSWSRCEIDNLMRRYGVSDDCTVFERVPHETVAQILADSNVALLLSRQEGSNRSVYEALFAGTPVIVYCGHRGINLDDIVPHVGLLCDDDELPDAIRHVVSRRDTFDPRSWALAHFGYENASRRLSAAVHDVARQHGTPWTRDIAAKKSAPNLRYANPEGETFDDEYQYLSRFLRPVA